MHIDQRKREILHQLYLTGYIEARQLAANLGVDASTIRRDLDALARDGHLQRTHGGARPLAGTIDLPYAIRQQEHLSAKHAIALAAAQLVQDGDRILLDSGSTTYQLAVELRHRANLTIVVNDLLIAHTVADYEGVRLLVSGGELLTSTYTLVGDRAIAFIGDLRVDWTFLGADAIDLDAGITNTNTVEIGLKRMMLAVASKRIVLADSSKFGQHALVRVAEVTEVDRIITDDGLSPTEAMAYGERLERVSEPTLASPAGGEPASPDAA